MAVKTGALLHHHIDKVTTGNQYMQNSLSCVKMERSPVVCGSPQSWGYDAQLFHDRTESPEKDSNPRDFKIPKNMLDTGCPSWVDAGATGKLGVSKPKRVRRQLPSPR